MVIGAVLQVEARSLVLAATRFDPNFKLCIIIIKVQLKQETNKKR